MSLPRVVIVFIILGLVPTVASPVLAQQVEPEQKLAEPFPWSQQATWTTETQEVYFESDGIRLAGTLFVPDGVENGPAVVVTQQAGTETRDDPLFQQAVRTFNAIGYSAFVYDRRGRGESEGDPARPDYGTLARDAAAAIQAIGKLAAVHPDKIGLWGHSQGGWIAMDAGTMSNAAFVVSVAAPLTTPGEQMEFWAYSYTLVAGHGEAAAQEAREVRHAVADEYFRGLRTRESAQELVAQAELEPWFQWTMLPGSEDIPADPSASPWIHEFDHDPVESLESLEVPVLLLFGGEDFDIPVGRSLEILEGLDPRDTRTAVVIPGANHAMRNLSHPAEQFEWTANDVSDSEKYFIVLGTWLGSLNLEAS